MGELFKASVGWFLYGILMTSLWKLPLTAALIVHAQCRALSLFGLDYPGTGLQCHKGVHSSKLLSNWMITGAQRGKLMGENR